MRILFLGDVMGRTGRDAVLARLPELKQKLTPDVVIINVENAAAGFGVTTKIAQEFLEAGFDCLTTGNHVWGQRDLLTSIDSMPRVLRPLNFSDEAPGKGLFLHTLQDGRKILIMNAMGRLNITPLLDDPFTLTDKALAPYKLGQNVQAIFMDFHAETTSEKVGFGHYLDGRVSAVVGTHTHIPTADAQILRQGTAFITDAGMCGDYDGILGMQEEGALWRLTRTIPGARLTPAEGEATLSGCFIVTDDKTGLALSIDPVRLGGRLQQT